VTLSRVASDDTRSIAARLLAAVTPILAMAALVFAVPLSASAADVVHYYHLDSVGNVMAVTDAAGVVLESHDYLPFGEEWCGTGPCGTVTAGQPKRFTGKERDAETGLDYFGARYYKANVGRFTTTDPAYILQENLFDPQRWNKYSYARNNPLRFNDPDGRIIDTIADVGFIAYDLIDIGVSWYTGSGVTGTQKAALGADLGAAAIPFVTGAGMAVRGAVKAEHAIEAARAGEALITANRAAGKAAEAKVAAELAAEGKTILGSQVCCSTSRGRRFIDHLTRDAAGEVTAVEVKSGNATRSAAQRAKDAEIAAGRGTFVGKNAPKDLKGTQRAVETIERKPIN
jgi:RHS repeat-associated protein